MTEPHTAELLAEATEGVTGLDAWQTANLHEMRRAHLRATAVEPALVVALARATARSEMLWRQARENDDFAALAPALETVIGLVRERAGALGETLGCAPYDALLDGYEPGITAADIDALFAPLIAFLPDFLERVLAHQAAPLPLDGRFPPVQQKALGEQLMAALGFDFAHGRLDESAHPFCGGVPDDVRLTARYDDGDVTSGLMAILHETGHALYNAGLPKDWRHQPVGRSRSMAVHESQSLLIEMQVCRSRFFLDFLAPVLGRALGVEGEPWSAANLHRRAIWVERGQIRVDADEVTYPLHVILRYRLEKALLDDDLQIADLPGAWNAGMAELLDVTPPNDRLGCLQDIHWPG
ncbi:MAG: carboxypeptidase M32, partial [Nitrospirota bacterium]|nr:carboxypeptidase M32 [Nitrospirota bacterium]